MQPWIIVLIVLGSIALLALIVYVISYVYAAKQIKAQVEAQKPEILENAEKAKAALAKSGLNASKIYGSGGWKYTAYQTKYDLPNNFNLVFDEETKKVAYYSLLPYEFSVYDASQIVGYGFSLGENHDIQPNELEERLQDAEQLKGFSAVVEFDDENVGGFSLTNHRRSKRGDSLYLPSITLAKEFRAFMNKFLRK